MTPSPWEIKVGWGGNGRYDKKILEIKIYAVFKMQQMDNFKTLSQLIKKKKHKISQ